MHRREFLSRALRVIVISLLIRSSNAKKADIADVYVNVSQKLAVWRK